MKSYLIMPFEDASDSFVHGFECGKLWQLFEDGEAVKGHLVHVVNKKQIGLMCELFGLKYTFEDSDDQWSFLTVSSVIE
jgi:hypothetical protein